MNMTLHINEAVSTATARVELARAVAALRYPGDGEASVIVSDQAGLRVQHLTPGATLRFGDEVLMLASIDGSDPSSLTCRFCSLT